MPRTKKLVDTKVLGPAETALALDLLGETDLLRLKTIARLHARGLPPDVDWSDLLQEAITRVVTGARKQPEGVPMIAFLAGIMRSLKAEHWRRVSKRPGDRRSLALDARADDSHEIDLFDPAAGPERRLSAQQELTAIARLFAEDHVALQIMVGLGEGLTAEQIRSMTGIGKTEYDSARRRMRRTLLKEGLTCGIK
jgi:RNA polymerase sigma-70 factor (ECF subfamily)